MYNRGDIQWKSNGTKYTPNQILAVLGACRVEVESETGNDFLCFCPFHGNNHTPSFNVAKEVGAYICFNPSCGRTGTIIDLIKATTGRDEFAARRLLLKKASETEQAFKDQLVKAMEKPVDFVKFNGDFDGMRDKFLNNPEAVEYMRSRQFTDETLEFFNVGYSNLYNLNLITVPMHDPKGMPIGLIGRCIHEKRFKNSSNLPKSQTLWNLHRARMFDTVVVCEASFDAMRIHQAGYPNVVAVLGGNISPKHFELFDKHFSSIIIMTDFDEKEKHMYKGCVKCKKRGHKLCLGHNPGRDLGHTIEGGLHRKRIMWASYKFGVIYPEGVKDAGDMTDEQIKQCVKNAVPAFEYRSWNLY